MRQCAIPQFLADADEVGTVQRNRPLAPLTRYRLGGPAEWFVRPRSLPQLAEVISRCRREQVSYRVLGGGANLLVGDDGIDGVVIRLDAPCFTSVEWSAESGVRGSGFGVRKSEIGDPDAVFLRAGAGADMAKLVSASVRRRLSGLEGLAGIPGSLGGSIRMNAGGRWGEICNVVREVTVIEPTGEVKALTHDQVGFSYRQTALNGGIVCGAVLQLTPGDGHDIRKRYREIWAAKKAAQPLAAHSAGCVFKNPPGDSAGRLIDQAGLKNRTIGTATVSPEHANFIVAGKGGRTRDVLDLISLVRQSVAERFAVDLELEIEVWQRDGEPC